jgi:hypothetical protein
MALCLFAGACGFEPDSLPDPVPEPPQPVWTLVYKANGGEGTMPPSTATENTAQKLSPNTFTRTYCTFAGWAKSKAGEKEYKNGETGVPGQAAEKTLILYALWDIESGQEEAVVTAATSGGTAITLTGVAWSPGLKGAVESALSNADMTLNLSGVSGLPEWSKDTLGSNKDMIKILVLPDPVTLLKDSAGPSDAAFNGYTSLESVSGLGVTNIGGYAFVSPTTKLTKMEFPLAATIGGYAFAWCANLTKAELPLAATIGDNAFTQCANLTKVELPLVKNIGISAFYNCQALAELFLPANPPALGGNAFEDTNSSVPLNIYVGLGNVPAYTSGWGVSAETAGGNAYSGIYGYNHKAITIME